jgi:hypothetical protein
VLAACAGILGLDRRSPGVFPHRAHVTADVSCVACHKGVEGADDGRLHLPGDASCLTCHEKPHDPRPCLGCHGTPGTGAALVEIKAHLRFDHARHLEGQAQGNCMRCHGAVAEGDHHLRPPMAVCFKCHGQAQEMRTCGDCHTDITQEGVMPASHLAHDGDFLREHGTRAASSGDLCETCHTQAFCGGCHGQTAPVLPAERQLGDPFAASVHRGGFAARHALEARADAATCTTCHQPARCLDCHQKKGLAGADRRSPHPPGWVGVGSGSNLHGREARRDPATCASCHGGAGEQLCVQCHAVGGVGGNPHPPGFSSRVPMGALPCRLCHPSAR